MVTSYLKSAWVAYRRNFFEILKAILIIYGFIFVLLILGMYFYLLAFNISDVEEIEYITNYSGGNTALLILSLLCFVIIYVVWTVLTGGFVRMCYESLKKRTKLNTMLRTAKRKAPQLIGVNILTLIIIIVIFVILFSTYNVIQTSIGTVLSQVLIMSVAVFVSLLFYFVSQAVVIDNLSVLKSVKRSVKVAKNNYVKLVYLFIVYLFLLIIVSFSFGLVPVLGPYLELVIQYFFISPFMTIVFTNFYVKNKR